MSDKQEKISEIVNRYWKFGEGIEAQHPTHSWHDKWDCLEIIRAKEKETESELQKLREQNEKMKQCLEYLDYCGGLGQEKHERIKQSLTTKGE